MSMAYHTITIRLEVDIHDNPMNLNDVRDAIASTIAQDFGNWNPQYEYAHDNGLTTGFSIDGRPYNKEEHRLAEYADHFTPTVVDHLMNGRKIQAIKEIRTNSMNSGMPLGLAEAKELADNWKP